MRTNQIDGWLINISTLKIQETLPLNLSLPLSRNYAHSQKRDFRRTARALPNLRPAIHYISRLDQHRLQISSNSWIDTEQWVTPIGMGGLPMRYIPNHVTNRIIAQNSLFTFHPGATNKPFETSELDKIVIPKKARKRLKQELYRYGVHDASMFPGLDGLCSHIKWMNEDSH